MTRPTASQSGKCFEAWKLERQTCGAALEQVAGDGKEREKLLDRLFELERLIIETPSDDLSAIRAKAATLLWYMEMEEADGLRAMRHIVGFLDGLH